MKWLTQLFVGLTLGCVIHTSAHPSPNAKRDLASIQGVLTDIGTQVTSLDTSITASNPDPSAIVAGSTKLVSTINSGVTTVQASAVLSDADALGLVGPVQTLSGNVNHTITDLISIKSKVVSLGYGCTTLSQLQDQLKASNSLSDAIVSKVPAELQSIAKSLAAGISSAIQNGVNSYSDTCTSSSSASLPGPTGSRRQVRKDTRALAVEKVF
ncbi:hydrophobic surface binding protein A-domain-containing protein [Talaromyces proteolyticus]|uniref:Cell wall mannoprotein 1 n=1 Tax=Talaromyces proteolyticus TaxID=1131652 RepID=A0AAD4KU14_9EURO|nr:hydrophobic surface binding protein A-domain-containing protein [Talaromyces proteolyticus]KAH8698785.1 hydrophobic surface binding protein A-domain-containing protein [Talaromyces proteolyticus]